MLKYILKRCIQFLPVLFIISVIIFILITVMPGDPFSYMVDPNIPREIRERQLKTMGFDAPIHIRYINWLKKAIQFDFGYSIRYREPVTDVVIRRAKNTFILAGLSLVFSFAAAVPLGIISATKKYSLTDYIATVIALIGLSIPSFFLGLLLIKYVAYDLSLFPMSGLSDPRFIGSGFFYFIHRIHHLVLPVFVLSLLQIAHFVRYTRSSMLEVINENYVITARAKGLTENTVIYKHALKNAIISIVTVFMISVGYLLSGAVLTETVFVYPGMGRLLFEAVENRDYPLLMGITIVSSLLVIISNLLADIFYAILNPKIRFD